MAAVAPRLWHGRRGLEQIAQLLWLPEYERLFEVEYALNLEEAGGGGFDLQPSTYRARLDGERAERYDRRRRQQQRDELAIALHANNQQRWSPSLLARSVAYYGKQSTFVAAEEGHQRRIASRPTTFNFLRTMRDCRPPRRWEAARHVQVYVADQTYEWVGMQKHGRRRTLERHDATGMPIVIAHSGFGRARATHDAEAAPPALHRGRLRAANGLIRLDGSFDHSACDRVATRDHTRGRAER